MKIKQALIITALSAAGITSAFAQTKWDLPAAYPSTNFHSENLVQFANDVDKASGGKLKITVHANASLFKATEIKRAVQGGQAQAGEILLANFQNEWQIFGTDGLPFLADSYDTSMKLYKAQKPALEKKLAEQGMLTGASGRNWSAYGKEIELAPERNAIDQALLSDPQTSGGLLVACAPGSVDEVLAVFHQHGFADACEVGEITPATADGIKLKVR